MKSGDSLSRDTLRMMISEVNNAKISLGHEPSEDEIIIVFKKESKKRREAIVEFEKANRNDLAEKEKNEAEDEEGEPREKRKKEKESRSDVKAHGEEKTELAAPKERRSSSSCKSFGSSPRWWCDPSLGR